MGSLSKEAAEDAIGQILLEQWDPLHVHETPGPHTDYTPYVHEVYGLLLRGGSDIQVERLLRKIVHDDMHLPEPTHEELESVLRALRAVERVM